MSFILDALKKSETDRQRQASPALVRGQGRAAAPQVSAVGRRACGLAGREHAGAGLGAAAAAGDARGAGLAGARAIATPMAGNTAPPGMVTRPGDRDAAHHGQYPDQLGPEHQHGSVSPGAGRGGPGGTPPLAEEPLLQGHEPAVPPDYDSRDYRPALTPAQAGAIAAARRNGDLPSRDEVLAQGGQLAEPASRPARLRRESGRTIRVHQHAQAARG